jgi:hypothetical protein
LVAVRFGAGLRSACSRPISEVTGRTEGVMATTIGELMAAWLILSVPLGIVVGRLLRDQNESAQR